MVRVENTVEITKVTSSKVGGENYDLVMIWTIGFWLQNCGCKLECVRTAS